jgi:predicted DNA-binding transcriptional regulator AlpA
MQGRELQSRLTLSGIGEVPVPTPRDAQEGTMNLLRAHDCQPTAASLTPSATRLLTIHDVADWLGVSKGWVYDHVTRKQPRLPCVRLGDMTHFRRVDIERFIEEHFSGSR